ncbi:MAG: amidohydrolase [Armatimonadetes bacterium]|nr:amidohydrolase [Armatimonadota bacterium]
MPVLDTHAHWGPLPYSTLTANREQTLNLLRQYRIDSAVFISTLEDFRQGNAALAEFLQQSPGMYGYALLHPLYPEESVEEMKQYLGNASFVGAAIHPYNNRYRLRREDCHELLNAYRRYTKPLFVSVPDGRSVAEAEVLAQEFNGIKFILGNMGGEEWHDAILACTRRVNMHLELSGEPTCIKIRQAVERIGMRRLLFGSDFGPSNPALILGAMEEAGLTDEQKQAILYGNAARLFGLSGGEGG